MTGVYEPVRWRLPSGEVASNGHQISQTSIIRNRASPQWPRPWMTRTRRGKRALAVQHANSTEALGICEYCTYTRLLVHACLAVLYLACEIAVLLLTLLHVCPSYSAPLVAASPAPSTRSGSSQLSGGVGCIRVPTQQKLTKPSVLCNRYLIVSCLLSRRCCCCTVNQAGSDSTVCIISCLEIRWSCGVVVVLGQVDTRCTKKSIHGTNIRRNPEPLPR
ncbi:hypothetical protein J3F84DRAFT_333735 [Trichoderma pleuroticola]